MSQDATHLGSFLDAYSLIVIDLSCLFLRFGISWPFSCFGYSYFRVVPYLKWVKFFVILFVYALTLRALFLDKAWGLVLLRLFVLMV